MKYLNEDLAEDLFEEYSEARGGEFRADEVNDALEVLEERYDTNDLELDDINLERYEESAIEIHVEGMNDSPVYSSPKHCVTHGNQTIDDRPPEGPGLDGEGDVQQFGIR